MNERRFGIIWEKISIAWRSIYNGWEPPPARPGIKNGRFIRMHRITLITRIAPSWRYSSPRPSSFLFLLSRRRVPFGELKHPSGSSQKIPALVLRALTPRGTIPNDQPQSEASVLNLPFLMPFEVAQT